MKCSIEDLDFLAQLNACEEGVTFVKRHGSLKSAWAKCQRSDWMCWLLASIEADPRQMRRLACRFVRETPLADGRKVWDLLTDERSRNAVVVAERFADENATEVELAAARAAAWDAAWAAAGAAARAAARAAAWDAAWAAAGAAARAAAWAAAWDAAGDAARAAAWDAQSGIIRDMFPWAEVAKLIAAKRKADA